MNSLVEVPIFEPREYYSLPLPGIDSEAEVAIRNLAGEMAHCEAERDAWIKLGADPENGITPELLAKVTAVFNERLGNLSDRYWYRIGR